MMRRPAGVQATELSHAPHTVELMIHSARRLTTSPCSASDAVNAAIRRLMDEPPSPQRTAAYRQLLHAWAEADEGTRSLWQTAA